MSSTVVTLAAACASWLLVAAAPGGGASANALGLRNVREPLERVAFGSCNDQSKDQPLWPSILARKPQLWLWMGDNIYGDYKEMYELKSYIPPFQFFREAPPSMLHDKYALQLAHPAYAELRSKVPVIGVWDDHDFGRNDGDRTYSYRAQSQSLFLDFVNEPNDSPRRRQEGVYTSYTVGSGERTVKFILLDVRYLKDPYDTVGGDFLGPAQWQWLERELATTDAVFNVIVSGIQVLPTDRFFGGEQWHRFAHQRERLLNTLLQSSARGVILLSGDVHFAEINQVQCHDYRNLIIEVTSSGLTHSVDVSRNYFMGPLLRTVFRIASWLLPWEFRPHHAQYYSGLNTGELTFHWDALPAPTATARVYDVHGNVQLAYTFASQFYFAGDRTATSADTTTAAASPAQTCKPIRQEIALFVLVRRVLFVCAVSLLLAAIPMGCALALGALAVAFRRALAFMVANQRELFDLRYQKIE